MEELSFDQSRPRGSGARTCGALDLGKNRMGMGPMFGAQLLSDSVLCRAKLVEGRNVESVVLGAMENAAEGEWVPCSSCY